MPLPIERSKFIDRVAEYSGAKDARAPGSSDRPGKLPGLVRSVATNSPYSASVQVTPPWKLRPSIGVNQTMSASMPREVSSGIGSTVKPTPLKVFSWKFSNRWSK